MIQIDIEKPKHCLHCPMCNGDDNCVLIQEIDTSWDWEEQYANCPLQEVEPERKKGKWKIYTDERFDIDYYKCSECGYEPYRRMDISNFCPDCGADMRGTECDK